MSILNYNIFDDARFMHRGRLKDIETSDEFTDCIEINFVELKKLVINIDDKTTPKELWVMLFNAKTEKDLNMLKDKSPKITMVVDKLELVSSDEEFRYKALMREKALRDYNSAIDNAEHRGIEKEKIEIAKKMLLKNIAFETISEVTGLPIEEIEKLKSQL